MVPSPPLGFRHSFIAHLRLSRIAHLEISALGKNDVGKVEGDAELFWCEALSFLLLLGSHIGLLVLRPVTQDLWNLFFIYISHVYCQSLDICEIRL